MGAKYHKFLIDNLKGTKEVKLELDWHGSGSVVFSYKTNKAEIAIAEISNKCGIK